MAIKINTQRNSKQLNIMNSSQYSVNLYSYGIEETFPWIVHHLLDIHKSNSGVKL